MKKYRLLYFALILLFSIIMGSGYGFFSINKGINQSALKIKNGSWQRYKEMDLSVNLLQRAIIARMGLFALKQEEVLYFEASTDSQGRPLESQYDYELTGFDLDARYWSITLYGEDFFLIPNRADKYSLNSSTVIMKPDDIKHFNITLSNKTKVNNWIPTGDKKQKIHLTLRLYNPSEKLYSDLNISNLPQIKRFENRSITDE